MLSVMFRTFTPVIYIEDIKLILIIFLAGYNNVKVAEFLPEYGANVNAQVKSGLIPLHILNYGNLNLAVLLIKYNTVVNDTDK